MMSFFSGLTNDQPVFKKEAYCRLNAMKGIEDVGGPLVTCQEPATIDCKNVAGLVKEDTETEEKEKPKEEAGEDSAAAEDESEAER